MSKLPPLSTNLLPNTYRDQDKFVDEWGKLSSDVGIMKGYIVLIEGWLCSTEIPWDVTHKTDYFSGHYQGYGLNVQAVCDANLWIIYIYVAGPIKMNDARAYCRLTGLRIWIDNLDESNYCSGNNTYPLSNQLLIPLSGSE